MEKGHDEFNGWSANLPTSYNVDDYNSEESKDRNRFTCKFEDNGKQKQKEYQSQISFKF